MPTANWKAATRTPTGWTIPIHAFDAIIADECHRGYTSQELSVWRDALNPSTPSASA